MHLSPVRVWDLFMFNDELDILEARLTELEQAGIYRHVITEATRDHYGRLKPLHYADNRERFASWADKIVHNVVTSLPADSGGTPEYGRDTDPWNRVNEQRNAQVAGLMGASAEDVVLISDADEIPNPTVCGLEPPMATWPPGGGHVLAQRMYAHAVDWQYPNLHRGTMSVHVADIGAGMEPTRGPIMQLLDRRGLMPVVDDGGWHLSWIGWPDVARAKIQVQAHLERSAETLDDVASGRCYREGFHEGQQLIPVDVDETWPKWIYERKCPESWFRPR